MDSAERRTDRGDDPPPDEDDLFFPPAKAEPRSAKQPPLTTPDFEPDEELERPLREDEPAAEVFEEPDEEPDERAGPAAPSAAAAHAPGGPLEDALAADLAAAEVEDARTTRRPRRCGRRR